jgi:hypothetical protein
MPFSKRLARLSKRGACRSAYLPFTEGDGKGISHARDPDPFGMVRHSPSVFSVCLGSADSKHRQGV